MINDFSGRYEFLSNFFRYDSNCCAEVFFQAMKATCKEDLEWILECNKFSSYEAPREAKRRGRKIELRSDWNKLLTLEEARQIVHIVPQKPLLGIDKHPLKIYAMYMVEVEKYSTLVMQQMLLDTANEELIEGNWWHDDYWGVCDGTRADHVRKCQGKMHPCGENYLGRIIMEVRNLKRSES